jgi:P2-related tail formation protein
MGFQAYTLFIFGSPLAMIDDIVDQHYLNFLFLIKKNKKKKQKNNQKQQQTTNKQKHAQISIH